MPRGVRVTMVMVAAVTCGGWYGSILKSLPDDI